MNQRKKVTSVVGLISMIILLNSVVFANDADQTKKKIPNIIIFTLSGVRSIDSVNDPEHQYMPYMFNVLNKEGTLYTNLIDLNYQFHMPSVSAIISGKIYSWNNKLTAPSFFQYARKQYDLPISKLWSFGDWVISDAVYETMRLGPDTFPSQVASLNFAMSPETEMLLNNHLNRQERDFLKKYRNITQYEISQWPQWDSLGNVQFTLFEKVLEHFKPVMVHYVMNDVESAHYGSFERYAFALQKNDERIYKIWKIIQNDAEYKDNTYLIVTIDHERNSYYMQHYDNVLENPLPVWMYIYGPNVKKNKTIDREVHHIDIFATISSLLDLETHQTRGNVLYDCLELGETVQK